MDWEKSIEVEMVTGEREEVEMTEEEANDWDDDLLDAEKGN